jgi:hypothetical protein
MKRLIISFALVAICSGCVWTRQTSEVTVHKDASGKVMSIDYTERLEQRDMLPWSEHFGKYLYNQ